MDPERALELLCHTRQIAADRDVNATVAIHDAYGHPVALLRGKRWHGPYMAMGKARLSAAFAKSTADLIEQWRDRPMFPNSLNEIIGVGGSSPDVDHEIATEAVASFGLAKESD